MLKDCVILTFYLLPYSLIKSVYFVVQNKGICMKHLFLGLNKDINKFCNLNLHFTRCTQDIFFMSSTFLIKKFPPPLFICTSSSVLAIIYNIIHAKEIILSPFSYFSSKAFKKESIIQTLYKHVWRIFNQWQNNFSECIIFLFENTWRLSYIHAMKM